MRPKIVVSRLMTPAVQRRIATEFDAPFPGDRELDRETVLGLLAGTGAEGLVFSSNMRLDADFLARLPDSVRVAATASAGFEHVDVDAACAKMLRVTNTPDVLTDCTADLTMLLILAACRRAHEYDAIVRAGWERAYGLGEMLGVRVSGRTLGIVGMGRIGQAVARRARGFGMPVLYCNRSRLAEEREAGAAWFADVREMLPRCQVLSLHMPAGAETVGYMDAEKFSLLPRGAVFVNASRGKLVDEAALLEALRSGHLYAAGLDVFAHEPAPDPRFAARPNVCLTPHMGSATVETRDAMGMRALDNVAAVLAGRAPLDPLW